MFFGVHTRANEVYKQNMKGKRGCEANKQGHMRFLCTRTIANEVHKHKIKDKLGCKEQKQTNKVAKYKN
jgi:hypothetical protein